MWPRNENIESCKAVFNSKRIVLLKHSYATAKTCPLIATGTDVYAIKSNYHFYALKSTLHVVACLPWMLKLTQNVV